MLAACFALVRDRRCCAPSASAQQRPLLTEDPEPIGAGRLLIEGGLDFAQQPEYPVSGLEGNLLRLPTVGVSFGISSIAEFQIDGGFYDRLTINDTQPERAAGLGGDRRPATARTTCPTSSSRTKIRLADARPPGRPALGIRFATKLPNASNESGLGLDTTDFYVSLLGAKTVQSIRVVGNLGVGILADPTEGNRQNDVLDLRRCRSRGR